MLKTLIKSVLMACYASVSFAATPATYIFKGFVEHGNIPVTSEVLIRVVVDQSYPATSRQYDTSGTMIGATYSGGGCQYPYGPNTPILGVWIDNYPVGIGCYTGMSVTTKSVSFYDYSPGYGGGVLNFAISTTNPTLLTSPFAIPAGLQTSYFDSASFTATVNMHRPQGGLSIFSGSMATRP